MLSPEQRETASEILKAMAHPVRLGVIEALAEHEKTVSDLYRELNCSQSIMSQQLRTLRQQGLITVRREGNERHYALRNPDFLNLFSCLRQHMDVFLARR